MSSTLACAEFVDLAAAVALDAIDEGDCARVEQHARECPDCGVILQQFRETAAALGAAVSQVEPPTRLRVAVLAAARGIRPVPRVERAALIPFRWRRPRVSAAWLVAAASMLVSMVVLGWVIVLNNRIVDLQADMAAQQERAAQYDHMVEVLGSPELAVRRMVPASQAQQVAPRAYGWVYLDPASRSGMLTVHQLPPLQPGRAWQLWFTCGQERVSGGMMWPDRYGNGYTLISLPQDLQSCEAMNLTEEPGSGSKWPTSPGTMWGRVRED